jgi:hypothetical protein
MMAADRVIRWTISAAVVGVAAVAAGRVLPTRLRSCAGAWRGGLDGPPRPAYGGRADLREFDGGAGLSTPQDSSSRARAVAPRYGNRGDARGQRSPRPRSWPDRRGSGRVASGSVGRLVRTSHGDHPEFSGISGCTSDSGSDADPLREQAAQVFAEELAADRVPSVRAIRAQLHVGSHVRSDCETTLPPRPGGMTRISPHSRRSTRLPQRLHMRRPGYMRPYRSPTPSGGKQTAPAYRVWGQLNVQTQVSTAGRRVHRPGLGLSSRINLAPPHLSR